MSDYKKWGDLSTREKILFLLAEQEGLCFWCQYPIAIPDPDEEFKFPGDWSFAKASLDHVIPRWCGGDGRRGNLVAACVDCNQDRGAMHNPESRNDFSFWDWIQRIRGRNPITPKEKRFGTNLGEVFLRDTKNATE